VHSGNHVHGLLAHASVTQVDEGKERLERILAAIQDAFMSLDARQRYSFVNANAANLLGAKKEGNHPNHLATIYVGCVKKGQLH
jgi:PAS domain-containing protein